MRSQFTLAALLSVSIVLLQACTTSNRPGEIAFLSKQKGAQWHIYMMSVDGSNVTQLQSGLVEDGCPVWSHSGHQIMFVSSNGMGSEHRQRNIYIANIQNSEVAQVTFGDSGISGASWSPDESRILYTAGPKVYPINIYMMNTDGSNVVQLTNHFSQDRTPVWSPDGQYILFSSNPSNIHGENPNYDIYVMGANGSNIKRLTDSSELDYTANPPNDLGPVWSPDGQYIAFYSTRLDEKFHTGANIFVMNADGSHRVQLTHSTAPIQNISPAWSLDGHRIAFASNRDHLDSLNIFDIYVMNADGSNMVRMTSGGNNLCPNWRP